MTASERVGAAEDVAALDMSSVRGCGDKSDVTSECGLPFADVYLMVQVVLCCAVLRCPCARSVVAVSAVAQVGG